MKQCFNEIIKPPKNCSKRGKKINRLNRFLNIKKVDIKNLIKKL